MTTDTTLYYSNMLGKKNPISKYNIAFGGCFTFTQAASTPQVYAGRYGNLNISLSDVKIYIKDLNNWIKSYTKISHDVVKYRGDICEPYCPKGTKISVYNAMYNMPTHSIINIISSNKKLKSILLDQKFYFRRLGVMKRSNFSSEEAYLDWKLNNYHLVDYNTREWYDHKIDRSEAWKICSSSKLSINKPVEFYSVDAEKQGKRKKILLTNFDVPSILHTTTRNDYLRSLKSALQMCFNDYMSEKVTYSDKSKKTISNMIEIKFNKTSTVCQSLSFLVMQFVRLLLIRHSNYKEIPIKYIHLKKLFPKKDFMEIMSLVNISPLYSYDPYKWPGLNSKYLFPTSKIIGIRLQKLHEREANLPNESGSTYNVRGSHTNSIFKGNRIDTSTVLGVSGSTKKSKEINTSIRRLHKFYREDIVFMKDLDVKNRQLTSEIATEWENLEEVISSLDVWIRLKAKKCKDTQFLRKESIYEGTPLPRNNNSYYKVIADDLIMRDYSRKRFVEIDK